MKHLFAFLALVLLASTAHGQPAPPSDIVIVACRAQVQTVFAENQRPIPNITYWELALNKSLEYDCQRVEMNDLQDKFSGEPGKFVAITDPGNITFADYGVCARAAMHKAMEFDQKNPGWLTVAVGCPIPILDDNGTPSDSADDRIVDWKLPGCPEFLPGTSDRMKCRFDKSHV